MKAGRMISTLCLLLGAAGCGRHSQQENAPPPQKAMAPVDYVSELRKAAEQGDTKVQYTLGQLFFAGGEFVPKDEAEAERWYRKAAQQGYMPAQFTLGVMYADGRGVPKDEVEATKWFRKAAEQGHAGAPMQFGQSLPQWRRCHQKL